jgi:hypothetical protein
MSVRVPLSSLEVQSVEWSTNVASAVVHCRDLSGVLRVRLKKKGNKKREPQQECTTLMEEPTVGVHRVELSAFPLSSNLHHAQVPYTTSMSKRYSQSTGRAPHTETRATASRHEDGSR